MENTTRTDPYTLPVQDAVPVGVIGTVQRACKAPVYCTDTAGTPQPVSRTDSKAVPIASQSELPFMDGPQFAPQPRRRSTRRQVGKLPAGSARLLAGIKQREKARLAAENQANA